LSLELDASVSRRQKVPRPRTQEKILAERIPVARYQPAGAALDIRDSSKAIQLRLEDKVRVIGRRVLEMREKETT
jgi:hypothetical protein